MVAVNNVAARQVSSSKAKGRGRAVEAEPGSTNEIDLEVWHAGVGRSARCLDYR